MYDDLTHAERARALVEDPERFEEISSLYDDEETMFRRVRNKAPSELPLFSEYLTLYRIFLNRGPRYAVRRDLERNLARSLKNMVIEGSPSGQAYPIRTLSEVDGRLRQFAELDIEAPSLREVTTTIIEHVYTEAEHDAYGVFCGLLAHTPGDADEVVEFLARARFSEGVALGNDPGNRISVEIDNYLAVTDDPRPDDRSAAELLEESENRDFADPEKIELVKLALQREPPETAFLDYLYLASRDIVERYRHASRTPPTLAELFLADRALTTLIEIDLDHWDREQRAYIASYHYVAKGIRSSGSRWASAADPNNRPNPNFNAAKVAYMRAAAQIQEFNYNRYIKFLSKAIRHTANAAVGNGEKKAIHTEAIRQFETIRERAPAETNVQNTIDASIRIHQFRQMEAAAHVQFSDGEYIPAIDTVDEAMELTKKLPQEHIQTGKIEEVKKLAVGRKQEDAGNFEVAAESYALIEHETDGLAYRIALANIKQMVEDEDYDGAHELAEDTFGERSIILMAVEALSGDQPTNPQYFDDLPADIPGLNQGAVSVLPQYIQLWCAGQGHYSEFNAAIRREFFEL